MNNHKEVEEIIKKINSGFEEEALDLFNGLLNNIPENSMYSKWTEQWIKKIYEFGSIFSKKNPEVYFSAISDFILKEENKSKKEVTDFIYSEIAWNYFSEDKTYIRNELKELKKKHPLNPEFYHSYSHVLENDGNYTESLKTLEQAIKIDPCERFINTYINRTRTAFNNCITRNRIRDAEKILNNTIATFNSLPNRSKYVIYTNMLPALEDRLSDHKVIQEKISQIDEIIVKRTEALRNRFISMLGVFAAIISFILVTTNIAISNLKVKEIMLLMLAMADVLIIFVLSIDYVFYVRRNRRTFFEFIKDKQFWGIVILVILLYVLFKTV